MPECAACRQQMDEGIRLCPRCGTAAAAAAPLPADPVAGAVVNGEPRPGPRARPARRSRAPFWFFVAAMAAAVIGGGAVVVMVKRTSADRRGFARDPGAAAQPAPAAAGQPVPQPGRH